MDALLDKAFTLNSNVEIGKFTLLFVQPATYPDGCDIQANALNNAGAANAGPVAGVAQESILPDSLGDYVSGTYTIASGTAWPVNSIPTAAAGRKVNCRMLGISRVVAASAISTGQYVNAAAPTSITNSVLNVTQTYTGLVKAVSESSGTVYVLGMALSPAANPGDVIRVLVMPFIYVP